jgi:hypothetical protein
VAARALQGMARVWSGQAPAWPLVYDRSVRRGSRVKRHFAYVDQAVLPVRVDLRLQWRLMLEGRTRILRGPSPDLALTMALHLLGRAVADQRFTIKPERAGCRRWRRGARVPLPRAA